MIMFVLHGAGPAIVQAACRPAVVQAQQSQPGQVLRALLSSRTVLRFSIQMASTGPSSTIQVFWLRLLVALGEKGSRGEGGEKEGWQDL
jgi:hypothetical protein